eukprot:21530_1
MMRTTTALAAKALCFVAVRCSGFSLSESVSVIRCRVPSGGAVLRNCYLRQERQSFEPIAAASTLKELPVLSQDEVRRYSRHLILPQVGVEGQAKLKNARVLCIGAGGLGSPATMYLAAAGVGHIGIVDDDVVDESNLQRQVIHGIKTLGISKVDSAHNYLHNLNPLVEVAPVKEQLNSGNALMLMKGYDVVLDGSDNFPTKYLVSDACTILGIPNVYGAILGFEGQVSVFSYNRGPSYRDLLPIPPSPGDVPSCAEGGVLGVLPGVIGCIQATEVLKIILGRGNVLSGRVLVYDALKMSFSESRLEKSQCDPTELIDYEGFCGFAPKSPPTTTNASGPPLTSSSTLPWELVEQQQFTQISVKETVRKLHNDKWNPFVLDVRQPQESEICRLPFTDILCPHSEVTKLQTVLPRDRDILVYCKVGGRSAKACKTLATLGYQHLFNLEGGVIAWAKEVDQSLAVY